jgi:excisionase family DNA binding protein
VGQVAELLEVSRATAYRLILEHKLPHVRVSNMVRVHVEQLRAYVGGAIVEPERQS